MLERNRTGIARNRYQTSRGQAVIEKQTRCLASASCGWSSTERRDCETVSVIVPSGQGTRSTRLFREVSSAEVWNLVDLKAAQLFLGRKLNGVSLVSDEVFFALEASGAAACCLLQLDALEVI